MYSADKSNLCFVAHQIEAVYTSVVNGVHEKERLILFFILRNLCKLLYIVHSIHSTV